MSESAPLDVNTGADAFLSMLEPPEQQEAEQPDNAATPEPAAAVENLEPEAEGDEQSETEEQTFTIMVDGKEVELTESQLAESYKSGLRQEDYTRKTMAAAEERKAAEAERQAARQERETYAQRLQEQSVLLTAALQEQNKIDWQQLLDSDPVEYLKQQHLYQQRHAALQEAQRDSLAIQQMQQAERAYSLQQFLSEQQENLLAKLPEWKDESKAKAEKTAIREYLKESGFNDNELESVQDHRHVIVARKAMLYDQMMAKAKAAAKKVENLPQKVQRTGNGESQSLDKRGSAFQKLSKSGRVEDAASVFASFL